MQCGVGHCGHCQLGPTLICRDGPVYRYDELAAADGGARAVSAATRKPKLAVWKFASCDGCQLSLLDCEDELLALAGEVEIAYFLEASRATVKGPYDLSLVEGSVTTAHDAERIQQVRRVVAEARHDRRLRDGRRRPGAAQLRRRRRVRLGRLRVARVRLDARDVDADLRARRGRLRAARLPDRQAPAARGDHGLPPRPAAEHPVDERLHGVQAARQRLRHGRARNAVPRPGHARRLRRDLSLLQPRLLRLLRADGDAEHRLADAAAARARHGRPRASTASSARSTSQAFEEARDGDG